MKSLNFNDGGTPDVFLDDDTMAADDPNAIVSQQSIVAYVGDRLRIKTGDYTGDGASPHAIVGIGFQVIYVIIWIEKDDGVVTRSYEATPEIMDHDVDGLCAVVAATFTMQDKLVISLDADGFTVESNNHPNTNANVYNYMCLGTE